MPNNVLTVELLKASSEAARRMGACDLRLSRQNLFHAHTIPPATQASKKGAPK